MGMVHDTLSLMAAISVSGEEIRLDNSLAPRAVTVSSMTLNNVGRVLDPKVSEPCLKLGFKVHN